MIRRKGLYERFFKRLLDIVLSLVALIILSPLLLIVALVVRVALGSPVLFIQERPGKDESLFKLYKFRSMTNDCDKEGHPLPDKHRLTKVGKFIRSLSIDELPSLWNVLKGDMSIIGPRPLLVEYLPLYNSKQKRRHEVRPGLSGLAQVEGRNAISWNQKFELDIKYIDNISFVFDLVLVLKTIKKVLNRSGISSNTSVTMEKFKGDVR